jgi:hypothetical protein
VVQRRQQAGAVRLAVHSPTWPVFRWLCLDRFRRLPLFRSVLRFLRVPRFPRVLRWVPLFLRVPRFRWALLWLRRFRWVRRYRVALRSLTCPVRMAVKGSRLARCRMERLCLVSQFSLVPRLTARTEADPLSGPSGGK